MLNLYMAAFLAMKRAVPSSSQRKPPADSDWVKTPYPNLIRYKPSGNCNYFGRVRVNGKLIRHSLKTHVLSVAKLKLSDFLQDHRRLAINKGQSVKGEVIIEMMQERNQRQPQQQTTHQTLQTGGLDRPCNTLH
jgi:hypothetical protein